MYEELIQRLENAAGGPKGIKMAHDVADAIAALQAENAELQRDAEQEHERYIETLGERDGFEARATALCAALSRVEAERDAAIAEIPHVCEHCKCAEVNGACKLLPDGDEFSPDYTDGFDRDGNCDHWEWRGAQRGEINMQRLTKWVHRGAAYIECTMICDDCDDVLCPNVQKAINRLAIYEEKIPFEKLEEAAALLVAAALFRAQGEAEAALGGGGDG